MCTGRLWLLSDFLQNKARTLPFSPQDTCFCSTETFTKMYLLRFTIARLANEQNQGVKRWGNLPEDTRQVWQRQDGSLGLQAAGQACSPCHGNVILLLQRGIMGFGKSSPFLAFSILVLCQAGGLQAAPFR